MSTLCPCCSHKPYATCCQPFHKGSLAPNALLLMRSRYSAYAKGEANYIILTTDALNPSYKRDQTAWRRDILDFCTQTQFQQLEILEFIDGEKQAYVSFIAHLKQGERAFQLKEKSFFVKSGERWLYRNGEILGL